MKGPLAAARYGGYASMLVLVACGSAGSGAIPRGGGDGAPATTSSAAPSSSGAAAPPAARPPPVLVCDDTLPAERRLLFQCRLGGDDAPPSAEQVEADRTLERVIDRYIYQGGLEPEPATIIARLTAQLDKCASRCSPRALARGHMFVGLVQAAGREDEARAQAAFERALVLDDRVVIDDSVSTLLALRAFTRACERHRASVAPSIDDSCAADCAQLSERTRLADPQRPEIEPFALCRGRCCTPPIGGL